MTGMPKNKFVDEGTEFGNFTFLRYTRSVKGDMRGLFLCGRCKEVRERVVSQVRTGYIKNCHCTRNANLSTHGHSRGGKTTPTFQVWLSMRKRCLVKTDKNFYRYGGRGISICERWGDFKNFLADMGEKPHGKSIDRINNNLGYSPENCRWATMTEQNNNRRSNTMLSFGGEELTLSQWAKRVGLKDCTLSERLRRGWSIERSITTPTIKNHSDNLPPALV